MKRHSASCLLFVASIASAHAADAHVPAAAAGPDLKVAADYMDGRQTWWMQWPKAQRDHATACVSCHTSVPYALARPSLRKSLGEAGPSAPERVMLSYIVKRVQLWDEVQPFYNDEEDGPKKTIEARGTESVMNALVLARYDADRGRLSADARRALDDMWAAQLTDGSEKGSWNWLNFGNGPWESDISHYYGSALAAIAVGLAPEGYAQSPAIRPRLSILSRYLTGNYEAQPLVNRVVLLWASSRLPQLMPADRKAELLKALSGKQRPDGGWSLSDLGQWKRQDDTPLDPRSDGYATGLTVYAMEQAGVSADDPALRRGLAWLRANQDVQGLWLAYSVNKQRDPASDVGRFMSDAATSYSVMALEAARP